MPGNMLNKMFSERSNDVLVQLIRYVCSGGLAFFVDKLLFVVTHYYTCHFDKYVSTTIGFSVGLIITYILSRVWIFNERRLSNTYIELLIFILIGIVGLLLMNFFMWLFSDVLLLPDDFLCNIISAGLVTLWNFIAKKYFLFTKK